ncbi:MAG: hypothetical protein R3D59_16540 [Paracoccaceae bacterium]
MKFKLIIVMTQDDLTDKAIEAARAKGAKGSTVINSARGEGLKPKKTFMGLNLTGQRDMVLFLVEEHHSREILEHIAEACGFENEHGAGVAFTSTSRMRSGWRRRSARSRKTSARRTCDAGQYRQGRQRDADQAPVHRRAVERQRGIADDALERGELSLVIAKQPSVATSLAFLPSTRSPTG